MKHILQQFDELNLVETSNFDDTNYIFVNSIGENFTSWIKINKLYQIHRDESMNQAYIIDEHGNKNCGFWQICTFKMYKNKGETIEFTPYLKNLKLCQSPKEQQGRLCFVRHPKAIDEGSESIYVIGSVDEYLGVVNLFDLDDPETPMEFDYWDNDVYLLDVAHTINRITKWGNKYEKETRNEYLRD